MSAESALLEERRDDGVALLTLNRPEQRNALSQALRDALSAALDTLAADEDVGAVLLTARGDVFCAGFDLKELAAGDPARIFAEARRYHQRLHTFPKPLIAAVQGPAMAGGMDLAALCDIRLAVETAEFGQPQVQHGLPAAWGLLRCLLPEPTARLLCLSGRRLAARELVACGFLAGVLPNPEALYEAALAVAADCAVSRVSRDMKQRFIAAQPALFDMEEAS